MIFQSPNPGRSKKLNSVGFFVVPKFATFDIGLKEKVAYCFCCKDLKKKRFVAFDIMF